MSVLSPFEVLTEEGWKHATKVTIENKLACVLDDGKLEYKQVRQAIVYNSNFNFNHCSLKCFSMLLCEGKTEPLFNSSLEDGLFKSFTPVVNDEYHPIPTLALSGTLHNLENLQIEAACKNYPLLLEYGTSRLLTVFNDFLNLGPIKKTISTEREAISFSCYKDRPTQCIIRLASFDTTYKTICLPYTF